MLKGVPNKRYTPEFKKPVVETMQKEKLSYREAARQFEVRSDTRIRAWERICLTEDPEGLAIERRGRGSKGCPPKQLPRKVEEDLPTEHEPQGELPGQRSDRNFFGLPKSELLYLQEFQSMEHFKQELIEHPEITVL